MDDRGTWNDGLHARCDELAHAIDAAPDDPRAQAELWSELFRLVADSLERWCRQSSVLRRAGLGSEDDWRAVFLRVVERLVRKRYANLRAYGESVRRRADGAEGRTPFEAWLRQLVRYAACDEVERCLSVRRARPSGGAATVERLSVSAAPSTSVVTAMAVRQRDGRLRAALQQLDDDQRCALLQRVQGASFEDIAAAMDLTPREAHDLVRAAKACLRRSLRERRADREE